MTWVVPQGDVLGQVAITAAYCVAFVVAFLLLGTAWDHWRARRRRR